MLGAENTLSFPRILEKPVIWNDDGVGQPVRGYKAIMNPDTGKLYSIVTENYQLIRHQDAIQQAEKAIDRNPDLGSYEVTTAFYNDGGRMRRTYRFDDKALEVAVGDLVSPELQLYNSYDTSWPFVVLLSACRVVCTNGLVIEKKFLDLRKRHVFDLDSINLEEQISVALNQFLPQVYEWREWANRPLTEETRNEVMRSMKFGKKARQEIEERAAREAEGFNNRGFPMMSLWIFFNVLTWCITHRTVSLNHRVKLEGRLRIALRHLKRGSC